MKPKDVDEISKQTEEFREVFVSLLIQSCGTWNDEKETHEFDSICISSYRDSLDFALEHGWIKQEQVLR